LIHLRLSKAAGSPPPEERAAAVIHPVASIQFFGRSIAHAT